MTIIRTYTDCNGTLEMVTNNQQTTYAIYLNGKQKYVGECFGTMMKHFVNIMYNMQHGLSNYAKY